MKTKVKDIEWRNIKNKLRATQLALEKALVADAEDIQKVYRARAIQLAERKTQTTASTNQLNILVFSLGKELYGIDVKEIAEVVSPKNCTPIPGSSNEFIGVINLRNEIVPVLDLCRVLELPEITNESLGYVILLRNKSCNLGLRVDKVQRIGQILSSELRQPGDQDSELATRFLKGLTPGRVMVLDTSQIISKYITKERTKILSN